MFKKGDRVILKEELIPDFFQRKEGCVGIPKGYIDIIRDVVDSNKGLLLQGIKNPISPYGCEYYYPSKYFEKLVSDEELIEYKNTISEPETNPITIPTPEPEFV